MLIRQCAGYELEKEQSNTSEDFFNRSTVSYVEEGKEKTLHLLYVRYFDEQIDSFTPYKADPVFKAGSREVYLRDIAALACLLNKSEYRHRRRVYINVQKDYADLFKGLEFNRLSEIFEGVEKTGSYEIHSPIDFIAKPL